MSDVRKMLLIALSISSLTVVIILERLEEMARVNMALASGKANYIPGAVCVISATVEQTSVDIIHFARACAQAHVTWLATNSTEE
jgi:hypothetical protein